MSSDNESIFGDNVIFSYSRKQAIEDGVLIDVSELAREAGFLVNMAVTVGMWAEVLVPTEIEKDSLGQSINGRLWDVFMVFRAAIAGLSSNSQLCRLNFEVLIMREGGMETVELSAVIGAGDEGEPVMTLMLPEED